MARPDFEAFVAALAELESHQSAQWARLKALAQLGQIEHLSESQARLLSFVCDAANVALFAIRGLRLELTDPVAAKPAQPELTVAPDGVCLACGVTFDSNNAWNEHIRATGHRQAQVPTAWLPMQVATSLSVSEAKPSQLSLPPGWQYLGWGWGAAEGHRAMHPKFGAVHAVDEAGLGEAAAARMAEASWLSSSLGALGFTFDGWVGGVPSAHCPNLTLSRPTAEELLTAAREHVEAEEARHA